MKQCSAMFAAGVLLVTLASHLALAQSVSFDPASFKSPERRFGYVLGDVLEQRIRLPPGYEQLDFSPLQPAARVSEWLQRQSAEVRTSQSGEQWLELRYQIVNTPETITRAALPEISFTLAADAHGTSSLTSNTGDAKPEGITLQAWSFLLGPLTLDSGNFKNTSETAVEDQFLQEIMPDHSLPPMRTEEQKKTIQYAVMLALLTCAAWGLWWLWREYRDKTRLPFADAYHQIGRLNPDTEKGNTEAWRILHHAFNQQAGHTVNSANISALVSQQRWLSPFQARIQSFYDASSARFFELPPRPIDFSITELSKVLYLAERKHSV